LSILELALGRFPYHEVGAKMQVAHEGLGFWDLLDKIVQKDIPELPADKASEELRSFLSQCLNKLADKRSTAAELLVCLSILLLLLFPSSHFLLLSFF